MFYEPTTNTLFGVEHRAKGGDEFNIIQPGENYGWPLFTYGINYDGAPISTITEEEAEATTVLPDHYWTVPTSDGGRSIAPACLLKVENSNISDWDNYFLIGSLAFRKLMKYDRNTDQTFCLDITGRVRNIKQLPSGDIIALIEQTGIGIGDGKIMRIKN